MAGQQNCQPKQLHGGFSVEREICTVELHTREVLRRFFGSQRFLGNWASPELPTLAVTRCLFGPDTQNWTPWKFYGQLSGVVAKLHTWAVSRRLFGPEQSIEILSREITSQLSGWWAGGIDTGHKNAKETFIDNIVIQSLKINKIILKKSKFLCGHCKGQSQL